MRAVHWRIRHPCLRWMTVDFCHPLSWWLYRALRTLGLVDEYPHERRHVWIEFRGGPAEGTRRLTDAAVLIRGTLKIPVVLPTPVPPWSDYGSPLEPRNDIKVVTYRWTGHAIPVGERPWPIFIFEEVP